MLIGGQIITGIKLNKQQEIITKIEEPFKMQESNWETTGVQARLLTVSSSDENKYATIAEVKSSILAMYPVGSIYLSTSSTNPSNFIGGTWVAYGQGRTLVGVGTSDKTFAINETGGESTHKLTVAEMPSHDHEQRVTVGTTGSAVRNDYNTDGKGLAYDQGVNTSARGGNGAHNNLQPYITCYMWKRTA